MLLQNSSCLSSVQFLRTTDEMLHIYELRARQRLHALRFVPSKVFRMVSFEAVIFQFPKLCSFMFPMFCSVHSRPPSSVQFTHVPQDLLSSHNKMVMPTCSAKLTCALLTQWFRLKQYPFPKFCSTRATKRLWSTCSEKSTCAQLRPIQSFSNGFV